MRTREQLCKERPRDGDRVVMSLLIDDVRHCASLCCAALLGSARGCLARLPGLLRAVWRAWCFAFGVLGVVNVWWIVWGRSAYFGR